MQLSSRRIVRLGAAALWLVATVPVLAAAPQLRLVPYATGFVAPVAFIQDPADPQVQFVVEQAGRIQTLVSGARASTPFLDITDIVSSGGERGLLGLAFPADAATSKRFYVNYTNANGDTVVARYTRASNARVADHDSGFPLQWSTGLRYISQPYANHNGGNLAFGPDGYLYVGMGDGGSGDDPENRAQNPAELLGKMLRVDVSVPDSDAKGFRVPADNPFVSSTLTGVRPEIWDFGVRNPWRWSFDSVALGGTGALIIADVGQSQREEIDYEPRGSGGRNYGWRVREGSLDHILNPPAAFLPLTNPNYEYDHTVGQSITGGYIYRGKVMPDMAERYVFGDFVFGRLWSAAVAVDPVTHLATFSNIIDHTDSLSAAGPGNISTFGIDSKGELFVVDYTRGIVNRLTEEPLAPTNLRIIR
jgi:glucose/arabinose dehydrogenase